MYSVSNNYEVINDYSFRASIKWHTNNEYCNVYVMNNTELLYNENSIYRTQNGLLILSGEFQDLQFVVGSVLACF